MCDINENQKALVDSRLPSPLLPICAAQMAISPLPLLISFSLCFLLAEHFAEATARSSPNTSPIDRKSIVSRYNPTRTASNPLTPLQVGNGGFAFGADVTGLQTFLPFAIMSSHAWAWKNDSFPVGRDLEDVEAYLGEELPMADGEEVRYLFGGEEEDVEGWLIANPNRMNLGRVGVGFLDGNGTRKVLREADLEEGKTEQNLDLWTGVLKSRFWLNGEEVFIETVCHQDEDVVGVNVTSTLLSKGEGGRLDLFLDFPWNDGSEKFAAPFVGLFNMTANHTTELVQDAFEGARSRAHIKHTLVNNTFLTTVEGSNFNISRMSPTEHRYIITPSESLLDGSFALSFSFSQQSPGSIPAFKEIKASSEEPWKSYWLEGGFVDLVSESSDPRAEELQRRIVLSQYLLRVNEAGEYPPQEVGTTLHR
jgi:hypothetical protein